MKAVWISIIILCCIFAGLILFTTQVRKKTSIEQISEIEKNNSPLSQESTINSYNDPKFVKKPDQTFSADSTPTIHQTFQDSGARERRQQMIKKLSSEGLFAELAGSGGAGIVDHPKGGLGTIESENGGITKHAKGGGSSIENTNQIGYGQQPPPKPESNDSFTSEVDSCLLLVKKASIAYNVPDSILQLGQSSTVKLLVDLTRSTQALAADLQPQLSSTSHSIQTESIQVTKTIIAQLSGTGFKIDSICSGEQPLSSIGPTIWKWDITATEAGIHKLHLSIFMVFKIGGEEQPPRLVQSFDKDIKVKVTFAKKVSDFLGNKIEWISTAIIIPLAVFGYKRLTSKKKKAEV